MVEAVMKFDKWPSGDYRPILSLSVLPSDIAQRFNGHLIEGRDDLDEFTAVCFRLDKIGPVLFISHRNDSASQTEVDVDLGVDAETALHRVLAEFDIKDIQVLWKLETT